MAERTIGSVAASSGRRNCVNALRLGLAVTVVTFHGLMLGGWAEPRKLGFAGQFEVDCFFIISGFFIAMSWDRLPRLGRFLWHRGVRIFPAFWACMLLTAALATALAMARHDDMQAFWASPHNPIAYVLTNSYLDMRFFDISGGPGNVPDPGQWNLSLWTLGWEGKAYLGLAALGLLARRRPALWRAVPTVALTLVLAIAAAEYAAGVELRIQEIRFSSVFLTGVVLYVWRDRLPYDDRIAAACAALTGVSWLWLGADYRVLGLLPIGYLTVWLMFRWEAPALFEHDISYGFYIYAFPVGQVLAMAGLQAAGYPVFMLVNLAATLPLALASWFLLEKPAMSLRRWTPGFLRAPAAPTPPVQTPVTTRG